MSVANPERLPSDLGQSGVLAQCGVACDSADAAAAVSPGGPLVLAITLERRLLAFSRDYAGIISYLAGDQQGTASAALEADNIDQSLTVTHRHFDPYGNPIGVAPPSWPASQAGPA
jgi:hypothetical protein